MGLLLVFTLCVKFALSILMMIIGIREISLLYKPYRAILGIFLVFVGVLGYVSSFY